MPKPKFVFFDVGNTLLFPNRAKMLAPIADDLHPTLAGWQELERKTKKVFDQGMVGGTVDHGFWWTFHTYLLEDLGHDFSVRDEMVANTQNSANWDQILPGTREALERIAQQFHIAVISNADGGIERVLSRCNIADCFQSITDSGIVGVEKPRVEIFQAALAAMNAKADESLYVGDVYSVDYLGARNAGMEAVLLDVSGAYRNRDLYRVESLQQLQDWLKKQV